MKAKTAYELPPRRRTNDSGRLISKFLIVLLVLANIQVSAQNTLKKVTISGNSISIKEVLRKVNEQTGFQFFYKDDLLKDAPLIDISVKDMPVKNVLEYCFRQMPVSFNIENSLITITRKPQVIPIVHTEAVETADIVTGTVTDTKGKPLEGVSVFIKGTNKGTATGPTGKFNIEANVGDVLEFTMVGYKEMTATVNEKPIKLQMIEQATQGSEIVVLGYGTTKKSDLTGSVSSLTPEKFTQGPNNNAIQLLNGRASGVVVSQTSSAPGSYSKIQIRGAGSINSSNSALVVIDGLPGGDPQSISPDDIKSIEVLKDASAAAIYGTRAANGVVLITTKSGSKGDAKVELTTSFGLQNVAKYIDVLKGKQYMKTLNDLRADAGQPLIYSQADIDKAGEGTDWQREVTNKNAPVQNYQVAISGGNDKADYYAGLNYYNQEGLITNSNFKKYNIRTNLNFRPKEYLRFKLNMNYTKSAQNSILTTNSANDYAGPINAALQFDPTIPTGLDANGRYFLNPLIALDNPLALVNGITDYWTGSNMYGTFATEIEPLKGLVATIRLGGSVSSGISSYYRDRSTILGLSLGGDGSKSASQSQQWLAEFLLRYEKKFGKDHSLTLLAGTTFEEFMSEGVGAGSNKFLSDVTSYNLLQSGDNQNSDYVSSSKNSNRLNGVLGRVNYSFKDRYLLTASFRNDGTSRFSDDHKFAFFPSGAFAWKVSKENFFNGISHVMNDLKLRVSYGKLGNQGIGNYQTIQTLVAGGSAVFGNSLYTGVVPARIPNKDLRWETSTEFDAGIDFSLLRSRINGSIDYFIRDTKDQLFSKPLPSVVGFSSILVNAGSVRNNGWDFELNTVNIKSRNFSWETALNVSLLKNEVTELPPFTPQIITGGIGGFIASNVIVQVGSPMYAYYGYEAEGIFKTTDEVGHSAQPTAKPGYIKFKDQNNDGKIDATDRVVLGDPFPDLTAGLNNKFTYKRFTLELFFQMVEGIQTLDANVLETFYPTNEYRNRISKYYENRWTPSNPNALYPSGVNASSYGGALAINSLTVLDASFVRFKTAMLNYNVPFSRKKFISSASIYVAADNIHTFTKYDGYDPDASSQGSSVQKVNYNSYPLNRTVRLGVNLTF